MADTPLMQKAVLEALEGKIKQINANNEQLNDVGIKIYYWDDLAQKHSRIFKDTNPDDVARVMVEIENKSNGKYKLVSVKPKQAQRNTLGVVINQEPGRPYLDISNLYWEFKYSEIVSNESTRLTHSKIFWLTPRNMHSTISGQKRSFSFRPSGVQYRLLYWFSEHEDFTKSSVLEDRLGTTVRTIGTEINKIRKKASEAFGIEGDDFIESNQGEGYKIGKGIKIKKESNAL